MATSLATLITAVRSKTDTVNNQVVTDSEITRWLNDGLCQLDMVLVAKFDDYKLSNDVLAPSATDGSIALSGLSKTFLKLRGVDARVNPNDPDGYIPIRGRSFQQRAPRPYMAQTGSGFGPYSVTFRLQDQAIILEPVAQAAQWSYRIWYTPDFIPLASSTDTLQAYMDTQSWCQYGVYSACVDVLAKQDLDPSTFLGQKEEAKGLIMQLAAPNRDAAEPKSVVDTRFSGGGWGYGWDW